MRIFQLFLICLAPFFLQAQSTARIYGRVADKQSLRPVDFATVYIDSINLATETDQGGNFSLDVPSDKSWTLRVSRIGYQAASLKLPALEAKSLRKINVLLASATAVSSRSLHIN